jgi:hypothetical protein
MAANSQQFGTRRDSPLTSRQVNEVSKPIENQLSQQIAQLTSVVQQLVLSKHVKPCGICQVVGHTTDTCPTLYEGPTKDVNAIGGFPGQPRQQYNPYSNTYNEGWRDHPNFRYGNQQNVQQPAKPAFNYQKWTPARQNQAPQVAPPAPPKPTTEDLINAMLVDSQQFKQQTQAALKSLENQVGQLSESCNRMQSKLFNQLPSQPEKNPKENASAVTFRSGKHYNPPIIPKPKSVPSKS